MPANPGASRNAADRVQVAPVEGAAALFTPEFRDFLVRLCDEFTPRAHALRAKRDERLERALKQGRLPAPRPASAITTSDWKVPPVPKDLATPGIEISGPCSITSMFINALNPGPEGERAEGDLDDDEDSAGHRGVLRSGDVQWMTAGAGIVHSEMPSRRMREQGGRVHGFQIWVNLPARLKMTRPRYQEISAASIPEARTKDGKARVRVIAGEALGARAVIDTNTPIVYQEWSIDAGADVVELDVRLTADAVPVVSHDPGLARATGDGRMVGDITLAELKRLDASAGPRSRGELSGSGGRLEVPTLREAMEVLSGRAGIDIEIKNIPGQPDFDSPREAVAEPYVHLVAHAIEHGVLARAGDSRGNDVGGDDPAAGPRRQHGREPDASADLKHALARPEDQVAAEQERARLRRLDAGGNLEEAPRVEIEELPRVLAHARLINSARPGARGPRSRRRWLACTPSLARAGLARPPIPQRGLGPVQSAQRCALAPPCASHGDTARHTALRWPLRSGPPESLFLKRP